MCDMPHSYVWHASFICVTCLIHMCYMTHGLVEACHTHKWGVSHTWMRHVNEACLIHVCDTPHLCVWHASIMECMSVTHRWGISNVTCFIYECTRVTSHTISYASFMSHTHTLINEASHRNVLIDLCDIVKCLLHMCNMPHSYVRHASFIHVTCFFVFF